MKNTKITLFTLALLGLGFVAKSQDPHFSQYYANPLYLNPAFAGVSKCPRFNLNYRNQYPVQNVYQTYTASYDQYVRSINGGIGVVVLRDEAGDGALTATEVSGIYSYHLKVSRKFTLLGGLQATFRQRALDSKNLKFPDQIDPYFGFVRETVENGAGKSFTNSHFDISAGLIGYTEKFYFGFSAHHLTQPNEAFFNTSELPMKLSAQAGFTIPLGKKRLHNELQNYMIPNVVYQNQGSFDQLTISTSFNRGAMSGGLGVRTTSENTDAIVILLGYAPNSFDWKIGYSYDVTISQVANDLGGAHEISLSYQLPCRPIRKKTAAIKCPKF